MGNMEEKSGVRSDSGDKDAKPDKPHSRIEGESIDEVIELSEIALGRSPGEDSIIELTEDAAASDPEGLVGAAGGMAGDENRVDFPTGASARPDLMGNEEDILPLENTGSGSGDKIDAIEEDITKELDNYFQLEEQAIDLLDDTIDKAELHRQTVSEAVNVFADEPISLANEQFETALENVIEKLYAEKIDRILNEVIERIVTDDIEQLKEYILKHS